VPSSYQGTFIHQLRGYIADGHKQDYVGTGDLHAVGGIKGYLQSLILTEYLEDNPPAAKTNFIASLKDTNECQDVIKSFRRILAGDIFYSCPFCCKTHWSCVPSQGHPKHCAA
jgi:hypothetical protein